MAIKRKIISRYLFQELLSPFFLGISVFTFIFLMNRILKLTEMVVNRGVGLSLVLKLLVYTLPAFLVFTIPMAVLLAVISALGRLSTDGEVISLKASGVSLYQLAPPFLLFSFVTYAITAYLTLYALPWSTNSFQNLLFTMARTCSERMLKEKTFNDDFEGLVIYPEDIDAKERKMKNVLISDRRDRGTYNTIIAKEGYIFTDPDSNRVNLKLFDGIVHRVGKDLKTYQMVNFQSYDIALDLTLSSKNEREKKYGEMDLGELRKKLNDLRTEKKDTTILSMEINKKFALPFACFVFGIIGIPLGIQPKRSARSYSLILSLSVFLLYYILISVGEVMVKSGLMPVLLGAWLANGAMISLGIYLFVKAAHESPITLLTWLGELLDRLSHFFRERFVRG
ncbi:MAG TPA: LPS export ABC transporter permease LptF [Thermodesulfobacteriota bacterium]|nr:LPS export ABC transporter permease LptF [Thermodesulfobacteriota bacterium]